jgi:SOS response regulatory protein OraA/RecX
MSDQRLLDYIQQQLQKGVAKDAIKAELVSNGWSDEEVEQAISEATVCLQSLRHLQAQRPKHRP